jgi:ankyrin repeat protein
LTRRGFLWILAALSILPAALAFGAPGAAAQETPRKSAKPQPPNEEYLRKVIKWNPWFLAAASGDAKTIQDYLTSGTQINARDTFGRTALYIATAYEHADIVRLLLKAGADPNLPSEGTSFWSGGTASRYQTVTAREAAGKSGNKEIEATLAEVEAKKESPPSLERKPMETPSPVKSTIELPPFFQAIADNSSTTLCSLLEKEHFDRVYDDHRYNTMYGTLPDYALMMRRENLYAILLAHALDASSTQMEKHLLLKAAIEHNRTEDVRRLLKGGASVFVTFRGTSHCFISSQVLRNIIEERNKELLRMLLEAGVKPDNWLLSPAALSGDIEMVKMLEVYGVTVPGKEGNAALSLAVHRKQKAMAEYLLGKGADPNISGENGFTLVERAILDKRQDIVDLLIQKGAAPVSEERRNFLVNPPRDCIVTTETLVSSEVPAGSLANTIDLNRYNLYQVTRKENAPGYPSREIERFLVFAGSPDRIFLGSSGGGISLFEDWGGQSGARDATKPKEWIRTKWAEPGKIAAVAWLVGYTGSGGVTMQYTSILLVNGNRVRPVFTWNYEMHAASGVSHWQNADQTWSWDVSQRILTIHLTSKVYDDFLSHQGGRLQVPLPVEVFRDFMPPCRVSETTRRYQLAGEEMRYVGGKRVESIAGGFPVLDVAEEYGLTIRRLVELNPELKGKVFCTGPVVVSTSIPPIDKDR